MIIFVDTIRNNDLVKHQLALRIHSLSTIVGLLCDLLWINKIKPDQDISRRFLFAFAQNPKVRKVKSFFFEIIHLININSATDNATDSRVVNLNVPCLYA